MEGDQDASAMSMSAADALAARLLEGVLTKQGECHIEHARRVATAARRLAGERVAVAALLHDVLEKTTVSADELRGMTGDDAVVDLVETLTHRPDEPVADYLARCAGDPAALLLKRLDLEDKLRPVSTDVPATVAERVRREAIARLAALERLVEGAHGG